MKALNYNDWGSLRVEEIPVPQLVGDEVLVRVDACGICGSELETFRNNSQRRTPPIVMGHEFCGEVVDRASDASVQIGSRVVPNAVVGCGECAACAGGRDYLCSRRRVFGMHMPGAFAEYVAVPSRALIPWPENLKSVEACLAEPAGNAIHVYRSIEKHPHDQVVVLGAGPIGIFCQQIFQTLGKSEVVVSDPVESRRVVANGLGACLTIDPTSEDLAQRVSETWGGTGAMMVIDAVGSAVTKRQSLEIASIGGSVVWIGLHSDEVPISTYDVTLKELNVVGTYGASATDMELALSLMQSGGLDASSWISEVSLDESQTAFMDLVAGRSISTKVVVKPTVS